MTDWLSPDGTCRILIGDVRERLRDLPDESVHCVVTSPPYWGLRDYGTGTWEGGDKECDHRQVEIRQRRGLAEAANACDGGNRTREGRIDNDALWIPYRDICGKCGARRIDRQLGLERVPDCLGWATGAPCGECYICHMVAVFRDVRRVLRSDGVCFVNLGDSYAQQGGPLKEGGGINDILGGKKETQDYNISRKPPKGMKPKDLCGIPWRFALAAQADGWYLRSDIPWVKRSAMPESVRDRPAKALEYVFLLTKSPKYYFDMEAVRQRLSGGTHAGRKNGRSMDSVKGRDSRDQRDTWGPHDPLANTSRNFRNSDLWFQSISEPHGLCGVGDELVGLDVNPFAYEQAHFATFSPKLVEPFIKAGTSEKGCCPTCGAPWRRVVEKGDKMPEPNHRGGVRLEPGQPGNVGFGAGIGARFSKASGQEQAAWKAKHPDKTTGWQPTCTCGGEPVPCVVLDPFGGSGTTGQVARLLGRHAILCELSEEYAELAKVRIMQNLEGNSDERPLLLEPAKPRQRELL